MLPHWPSGTVVVLVTVTTGPHAIPVSAALRAGPSRILLGLANSRGSLQRLREQPEVAVALLAADLAMTARGRATVLDEPLVSGVSAVEVQVESVDDHLRPTFELQAGVRWRWTDDQAADRDDEVHDALARLARHENVRR